MLYLLTRLLLVVRGQPCLVGRHHHSLLALLPCAHCLLQGLTHTGAINCKIAGDGTTVMRAPQFCKPDWYGDRTSFMGKGATLQLPAAIKYKVTWHMLLMQLYG